MDNISEIAMTVISEDEVLIAVSVKYDSVIFSKYVPSTKEMELIEATYDYTSIIGLYTLEVPVTTSTANKAHGSLMSITASGEGNEIDQSAVAVKDGEVIMYLSETAASTNGKIEITFDPSALSFKELVSGAAYFAVNTDDAENGKIVFTYASATEIPAENILATLTFETVDEKVDTTINVETIERNDEEIDEDATEVAVNNKSSDNALKILEIANGELDPEFDPLVNEYEIEVGYEVENLGVIAVARDEAATVEIDNPDLVAGETTTITVTVTAENGEVRVYTINVTREAAPAPAPIPDTGDPLNDFSFVMLLACAACAAYLFLENKKREA